MNKKIIMVIFILLLVPAMVACSSSSGVAADNDANENLLIEEAASGSDEPAEADNPGAKQPISDKVEFNAESPDNIKQDNVSPDNINQDQVLKDRVICIDPGHQSRANYHKEPAAPWSDEMKTKCSSGTAGIKTKIPEYKLNLVVSLKLKEALEAQGAKVVMTRTGNEIDISNADRAKMANDSNAVLYLRIHADGSTDKSISGVSVLIPDGSHIKEELKSESAKAGKIILDHFIEATNAKSRGLLKRSDLSGFNWCTVPMVLVEMGFLTNAQEDERLNSADYQEQMVQGIVNGVMEYCNSSRTGK